MQRLTLTARRLFISYFLCSFGDPIFGIFTNVYLWRESQDPIFLTVYNLFLFMALPLGFFIAMKLSFLPTWFRYGLGGIAEVASIIILFQFSSISLVIVAGIGFLFGLSAGMYWFTRNLFTWKLVRHKDRLYFASREWGVSVFLSFVLPLLIGWAITLGIKQQFFVAQTAYEFLSLSLIGVFGLAGFFVIGIRVFKKGLHRMNFHVTKLWQRHRLVMLCTGVAEGMVVVVPAIAIFKFVGLENAIGTITAVASLVSGVIITIIGNRAKTKNEPSILLAHTVASIIGYSVFSIFYNTAGVILFFILNAFAQGLRIGHTALINDTLDRAVGKHISVTYLVDQEFFLNCGRALAIVLFLVLYMAYPADALRYSILIPIVTQVLLLFFTYQQIEALKH